MYKIIRFLVMLPFNFIVFLIIAYLNISHSRTWSEFVTAMKGAYNR